MKNTKQAIALASAAALSVGMLAGCGGAASSAATASSESNSTATAEASTATPGIPPASALLKASSFESNLWVEPIVFTSNLPVRLRSLYTQ